MLSSLQIENVAVIQKAEVHFEPGLNVLTGETGAGKSILIDSINAILGNRTSKDLVRTGASKAVIRAAFEQVPSAVLDKLEQSGYERSEALLLSREIKKVSSPERVPTTFFHCKASKTKAERLQTILRLVQEHPISRQEVLLEHLRNEGFEVTQATVSRDIRELCLVKAATTEGYRYVSSRNESFNPKTQGRFETIFHESVLEVDYAGHVVLVKCYSGMANAAC